MHTSSERIAGLSSAMVKRSLCIDSHSPGDTAGGRHRTKGTVKKKSTNEKKNRGEQTEMGIYYISSTRKEKLRPCHQDMIPLSLTLSRSLALQRRTRRVPGQWSGWAVIGPPVFGNAPVSTARCNGVCYGYFFLLLLLLLFVVRDVDVDVDGDANLFFKLKSPRWPVPLPFAFLSFSRPRGQTSKCTRRPGENLHSVTSRRRMIRPGSPGGRWGASRSQFWASPVPILSLLLLIFLFTVGHSISPGYIVDY